MTKANSKSGAVTAASAFDVPGGENLSEATAPPQTAGTEVAAPGGKLGIIVRLVSEPDGATIQSLAEATGWQNHSVRGCIAGALKRRHGLTIKSHRTDAGRFYRLEREA